jgi:hypothetical protein
LCQENPQGGRRDDQDLVKRAVKSRHPSDPSEVARKLQATPKSLSSGYCEPLDYHLVTRQSSNWTEVAQGLSLCGHRGFRS